MSDDRIHIDWSDLEAYGARRPVAGEGVAAGEGVVGQKCPICHAAIEPGEAVRKCSECKLWYHVECWADNCGCATFGCANSPDAKAQLGEPSLSLRTEELGGLAPPIPSVRPAPASYGVHPAPVSGPAYAGFWLRFIAAFIDGLVLVIPSILLMAFLGVFLHAAGANPETFAALLQVGTLVVGWLYYAGMESSGLCATIGKRAMGIAVTDVYGNPITFAKASGRFWGKLVSAMMLYVGFLMAAFTSKKQALHDMMAGCLVVRR
ncbi:MAG TPA: hypothetical protein ENN80_15275 [Candidatus Hydrogenedentes bacterium]|nr:hypothetical protein [Candidatus Hydrogenedentota bacterium]